MTVMLQLKTKLCSNSSRRSTLCFFMQRTMPEEEDPKSLMKLRRPDRNVAFENLSSQKFEHSLIVSCIVEQQGLVTPSVTVESICHTGRGE